MATKNSNDSTTTSASTTGPAAAGDAQLREQFEALQAQMDRVLDYAAAQQDEIDTLKTAQTGKAAVAVAQNDTEAELDAELAGLIKEFADYPLIDVFERRALVGLDANTDLRLKDDPTILVDPTGERCKWKLRWFNFGKEGRAQQAQAEGYLKVRWEDLADQEAIATGARVDEYVKKGNRGEEVLCKIPRKMYDYKKRRDAARSEGLLSSESGMRDRVANRVSSMVGARGGNADQAGSFLASKQVQMTITKGETERFTP